METQIDFWTEQKMVRDIPVTAVKVKAPDGEILVEAIDPGQNAKARAEQMLEDYEIEKLQAKQIYTSEDVHNFAVNFLKWVGQNQYMGTSLAHQEVQYFQRFDLKNDDQGEPTYSESDELTSEQLLEKYLNPENGNDQQ